MQFRKLSTFAVTSSFILFTFGQQPTQATPGADLIRDGDETRLEADAVDPRAGDLAKALTPRKGGGAKKARTVSAPPRGLTGRAKTKAKRGRKSRRESAAAVAARRLYLMKRKYILRTNRSFVVTSFRRGPAGQARAIRRNLQTFGTRYVVRQYHGSPLIYEILRAYKANRRNTRQAERQMAAVIREQVARGQYVSGHLRGQSADIRSHGRGAARLSVLRKVAHEVGAKVSVEKNHYHVNLV